MDKTIEIKIEKMIPGGKGMGYHDGKVVFADYCVAGDQVVLNVTKEKKKFITGDIATIKEPSPQRIDPECVYFSSCGGCSLWHIDYDTELAYKKEWFIETLDRIGKVKVDDVRMFPAPNVNNYRNRVQFKVRMLNGRLLFGFNKRGTTRVVNIGSCMIANERINEQIAPTKKMLKALSFSDKVQQIDFIVDDANAMVTMLIHIASGRADGARGELKRLFKENIGDGVKPFLQFGRKSTITPLFDDDADVMINYTLTNKAGDFKFPLAVSPGSFLQVNYAQNQTLIDIVLEYLSPCVDDEILDLFCGAGNFSFAVAQFCKSVTGIESYGPAVVDAKSNMERLNVGNVEFIRSEVSREVDKFTESGASFDAAIIDPPREGARSALKDINNIIKKKIIYISCDMATFARDTAFLSSVGFELGRVSLVDMFPRTHHVEVVAEFTR